MILYTRQEDTQKMKIVDEYFGCDVFSTSAMQKIFASCRLQTNDGCNGKRKRTS